MFPSCHNSRLTPSRIGEAGRTPPPPRTSENWQMATVEAVVGKRRRDALFSSPRCGLELLLLKLGGRAAVARWLGRPVWMVDPRKRDGAGGWGTPPSRPSNQGHPGGTRGGSASPYWLAVNKRGPTPCKHASSELLSLLPMRARCCPTVACRPSSTLAPVGHTAL
jgi:hypothetical protein